MAARRRFESHGKFRHGHHLPSIPIHLKTLRPLIRFFTCLAILTVAALGYDRALTPLLTPPDVAKVGLRPAATITRDRSLDDLFPEGAWQRESCNRLQTANATLLFKTSEQIGQKVWEFKPVTVIYGRGFASRQDEEPVLLRADEGASIVFSHSLDMLSGRAGGPPIDRGQFIGEVQISRQELGENSLSIRTSNVGIDRRRIWTTETIDMRLGEARLLGRDLTIHLASLSPDAATGKSPGGAGSLDRMELIYLDELSLPLRSDANGSNQPGGGRVEIDCAGRVEYDFAVDTLWMHDAVDMRQIGNDGVTDRFTCESLTLQLRDPFNSTLSRGGPFDWIAAVQASGDPAIVDCPSHNIDVRAHHISLDAIEGTLVADGPAGVFVRRGSVRAQLGDLHYRFDPQRPKKIGAVTVDGVGVIQVDAPDAPLRHARWDSGLRFRPASPPAVAGEREVIVDGNVRAALADNGQIRADSIQARLQPDPSAGTDDGFALVVDRFLIAGCVHIDTAQIAIETEKLTGFVIQRDRSSPDGQKADGPAEPANRQDSRPLVRQPDDSASSTGLADAGSKSPVPRSRPTVRGDSIAAEFFQTPAGVSADRLVVIGNVGVDHEIAAGAQRMPVQLSGDELQYQSGGGIGEVLSLRGTDQQPARFDIGSGYFLGPLLKIWPAYNRIEMPAAGEFEIPIEALPPAAEGTAWFQPPKCHWRGHMIFDGAQISLTEGVDLTAGIRQGETDWKFDLLGDDLRIDLESVVEVRDMKSLRSAAIKSVTLSRTQQKPVFAEAISRGPDGAMVSRHLVHANELELRPLATQKSSAPRPAGMASPMSLAASELVGRGPGWYRSWFPARDRKSNDDPLRGEATMIDAASTPLTGVHLAFDNEMLADLAAKSMTFDRRVRVGIRPVRFWDEQFDVDAMQHLAVGETTLRCEQLRVSVDPATTSIPRRRPGLTGTGSLMWELEAFRGVLFRTRTDQGWIDMLASRASYASGKDLFTVQGTSSEPVIFQQTKPDGTPGTQSRLRSLTLGLQPIKILNAELDGATIAAPPPTRSQR